MRKFLKILSRIFLVLIALCLLVGLCFVCYTYIISPAIGYMTGRYSQHINTYGITEFEIPEGTTKIEDGAFSDCDSLTSVTIPDSVTSIGNYAFYDCNSLTSVKFMDTEGWWRPYSSTVTVRTNISASDLANASTAASYLEYTYSSYYWFKK